MAKHGGYRRPPPNTPPGSAGANSRRTDGQKVQSPDLDRPDVKFGDRERFEQAQRMVPIPTSEGPPVAPPAPPGGGGGPLEALRGGMPDDYLASPTNRPTEPITTGISLGPGRGREALAISESMQEKVLKRLAFNLGDADAAEALAQMRAARAPASGPGDIHVPPEALAPQINSIPGGMDDEMDEEDAFLAEDERPDELEASAPDPMDDEAIV